MRGEDNTSFAFFSVAFKKGLFKAYNRPRILMGFLFKPFLYILSTSKFLMRISVLFIIVFLPPASNEKGYSVLPLCVCPSVDPSVRLSVTKKSVAFFSATVHCRSLKF